MSTIEWLFKFGSAAYGVHILIRDRAEIRRVSYRVGYRFGYRFGTWLVGWAERGWAKRGEQ